MMKFIFMIMMFFILFFMLNKLITQMFFKILMFLMFFLFLISYSVYNIFIPLKIYYMLSMDFYSWMLILLTIWIFGLMGLVKKNFSFMLYYFNLLNLMFLMLLMCFLSMNMLMFYIFFESSLLMVFMLILGWGGQLLRIKASMFMILYTLFGSMPLFLMINYLYIIKYTIMFNMILNLKMNTYMYISLILGFLIKMPMFMLHLWLPKAHVEAPLVGSMILAGVMLKLGSYGLLRVMMFMENCLLFNKFILIFSIIGGVMSCGVCLMQTDMKMLVAYSSVVHMSMLLSGLMTLTIWGYLGGLMMMISHGLCSSGLFCLVNINYERLKSRSLYLNNSMINFLPSLSLMWFLMISSNLSFPPSLNLFSEIFLLNSMIFWSKNIIFLMFMLFFFSATYSLYLYSFSQHGNFIKFKYFINIKINDFYLLILHWIPLNLMFLSMNMYL